MGDVSTNQTAVSVGPVAGPAAVCLNQTGVVYSVEPVIGVLIIIGLFLPEQVSVPDKVQIPSL